MEVKNEENIKNELHLSLDITKDNLGYNFRTPVYTDDEIYTKLGVKKCKGPEAKGKAKSEEAKKRLNYTDEQCRDWAKENLRPLPPDELEFIPRKYWCELSEFQGADLNNMAHPVYDIYHQAIKDNFKKRSDIMVIQGCADSKPYIDAVNFNFCKRLYRQGFYDFYVSSWNIVPIDFSVFFPTRYYNWNHALETPQMTNQFIQSEVNRIVDIFFHFDYKKLIMFTPGDRDGFYPELYRRLNKILGDRVIFIWDDECNEEMKKIGDFGVLKSHYYSMAPMRDKLKKLVGYDESKILSEDKYFYGFDENTELGKKQIEYIKTTAKDISNDDQSQAKPKVVKTTAKKLW